MPLLVDYEQGLQNMKEAINTAPTSEEFVKALSLAFGSDISMLYYPSAPSTGDYITTTTTDTAVLSSTFTSIGVTTQKTIDDIIDEKIEQYKDLMRLQALGCKNCGGTIDKDTMICEYCGTRYRN